MRCVIELCKGLDKFKIYVTPLDENFKWLFSCGFKENFEGMREITFIKQVLVTEPSFTEAEIFIEDYNVMILRIRMEF